MADERRDPRRVRPGGLAALAAAVTVAAALGMGWRWAGVIQLVALPPLDLVTDLRMLLVHAPNIPVFGAGLVLSLTVRSFVLASLLGPVDRTLVLYAVRFYLVVLPFAFLAAAMLYAAGAVIFYALFWFGVLAILVLLAATSAAPWLAPPRLRSGFAASLRHAFRGGTVGAYLAVLAILGFLADVTRPLGPVVLLPVSAAVTFAAAHLLHADPGWKVARRTVAIVPAAGIAGLVAVVALGPDGPPLAPRVEDSRDGSIMLMSGIDSQSGHGAILEIDPGFMGWSCARTFYYSYDGPGDGQPRGLANCPILHGAPYERVDTLRSREELIPFLEAQTEEMIPPGVVAGHSQGVWLLWQAAADNRLPNVATLVLVGPFPENPIAYPAAGQRTGGHLGRLLLGVTALIPRPGGDGSTVFRPDSPLGREWLGHPEAIGRTLARPLPEPVAALSIPSVFDLPLMPEGHEIEGATTACPIPVIHPNLPYSAELQHAIVRFVDGRPPPACPFWREAMGPLFRPFSAPPSGR